MSANGWTTSVGLNIHFTGAAFYRKMATVHARCQSISGVDLPSHVPGLAAGMTFHSGMGTDFYINTIVPYVSAQSMLTLQQHSCLTTGEFSHPTLPSSDRPHLQGGQ